MPQPFRFAFLLLAAACMWSADISLQDNGNPVSTVTMVSPLSITEAQNWTTYCQVMPVKEKDGTLIDTAGVKGQVVVVQSISYFKSATGQLYAIVNFLRPKTDDAKR